jgi:hypothetical protein
MAFKLHCDERFTRAFIACGCVFKEITLVGSNQGNYFENATSFSKRMLKTTVATQLYGQGRGKVKVCYGRAKNLRPNQEILIRIPMGISIIKSKNYEITLKKDAKNSAFLYFDS